VAYSLKAKIVESQQLAVIRQQPVNYKRGMVFSVRSVPTVEHATMEYVMPPVSNNRTATKERCSLRGPCRDIISRTVNEESVSQWSGVGW
jgi:hypothetical protein